MSDSSQFDDCLKDMINASFDDHNKVYVYTDTSHNMEVLKLDEHHAEAQRVVRRDDDEIHLVLRRPADDAVHVRRLERQAGRNLRDAAVAGRGVQRRHFRVFLDFQRDGVFASAAADDEYLHTLFALANLYLARNRMKVVCL